MTFDKRDILCICANFVIGAYYRLYELKVEIYDYKLYCRNE